MDHVLVRGVCHTPNGADGKPDPTKYLAGSRSYGFTDKDGTVVTVNPENLTSDNPEGLFTWSDEQIRTALTKAIDDEIIQYLRTIPPNDNVVPADCPYFDQNPLSRERSAFVRGAPVNTSVNITQHVLGGVVLLMRRFGLARWWQWPSRAW